MSNSHRRFHRRAPQVEGTGSNVKTVNVEVIATVDTAGNVVAKTTVTKPDSTVSTGASQVLPVTNASDVSAPSESSDAAASTPAVPSTASLPSETQSAVLSTPTEASRASVSSVSTTPIVAAAAALPSVPSVPAVPSVSLPSVPSVPAFPSDLTVPAYPYATLSVSTVSADADAASYVSSVTASSEPSIVAALTAAGTTKSTTSSISTSTSSITSLILSPSSTLLSTTSDFTYSSPTVVNMVSATAISSRAASGSLQSGSSLSTTASSNRATPTESLDSAVSSSFHGSSSSSSNGVSGSATAASPADTSAAAAGDSDTGSTAPLDTPQVVGSVVGSLAGAALILAIILMLLRRHKRGKGGALQLTNSHPRENEQQATRQVQAPAPAARASLVPSAFLNRFSGLSRSTAETSSPTERSFQRVSGRKLPSAFSEGMTSDQFARGGHMSGMTDSSFYQDDHGTYGGPGLNKEYGGGFGKEVGETSFAGGAALMNVRPSPARTPVIHHPTENPFDDTNRTLSPPMSPNPFSSPADLSPRAALGRSLHSADGSRSSRFTENV
ncbi:uncharacterized protein M421DRAFT_104876 [Didymella exigua CBS 183.55]|uniref:Uncharacterized protein n=1 Tax=Didymella exigua CBS 183.55 TaxID=1150837 RepID=A0A6A5R6E0_9PLEO|nr:uncharacterized protein M421DRAFT_104876 [Didymella exigua CBS 183.55]KAF1922758.1 hypothetical protein M421DRAFT_104876 [Didymella exigua CBS 183.55]